MAGVSSRAFFPSGVYVPEADRDPSSPKTTVHFGCFMKSAIKGLLLKSVTEVPGDFSPLGMAWGGERHKHFKILRMGDVERKAGHPIDNRGIKGKHKG